MDVSKKTDKDPQTGDDNSPEALELLADAFFENINIRNESIDSFELYAQTVRGRLYSESKAFKRRFNSGYKIIMDVLEKTSKK